MRDEEVATLAALVALRLGWPEPVLGRRRRAAIGPRGPRGDSGPRGQEGARGEAGSKGDRGDTGPKGDAGPRGDRGDAGPKGEAGPQGDAGPRGPAGVAASDFSVNAAAVDAGYADGSIVLRTGARTNPAGAFTGGGTGNKAIFGVWGFGGLPLAQLASIAVVWRNVTGPGGPYYVPPTASGGWRPYVNVLVDFAPNGGGDLRLLALLDDGLNGLITGAIGTYTNPGGANVLTYAWTAAQDVLIVGSTPATIPGGVPAHVTVGASWLERSYSFAQLVAANPDAVLVERWPNDGGMPAGAVLPAIVVCVGDSGNVIKSGKRITSLAVNGAVIVPL